MLNLDTFISNLATSLGNYNTETYGYTATGDDLLTVKSNLNKLFKPIFDTITKATFNLSTNVASIAVGDPPKSVPTTALPTGLSTVDFTTDLLKAFPSSPALPAFTTYGTQLSRYFMGVTYTVPTFICMPVGVASTTSSPYTGNNSTKVMIVKSLLNGDSIATDISNAIRTDPNGNVDTIIPLNKVIWNEFANYINNNWELGFEMNAISATGITAPSGTVTAVATGTTNINK